MKLSKAQRLQVWNKSGGKCWYCGCDLPATGWHADHFLPVERKLKSERKNGYDRLVPTGEVNYPERENIDNLVPSCSACNILKGGNTAEDFRYLLERIKTSIFHHSIARAAKRFGFLEIKEQPIVFWYEKQEQNGGGE
ncbi:MAG: HNH endonuclease signature motif containing protein [Dehalococcoidia bacterium]